MPNLVYLYLLIVCGFFCQGITASLSANNIRKSADFLVRPKRVINSEPGGNTVARFSERNYIVNIRQDTLSYCAGAILSCFTAITAVTCVALNNLGRYDVLSGSSYPHHSNNHSITSKAVHYGNPPYEHHDGIALFRVNPPFILGPNTGIIHLHVEPVLTGTLALISGWGLQHPTSQLSMKTSKLRSITLPIMNHRECAATYAGHFQITYKHICTYCEQKLCATNDWGTPLVIDGFLAGIHNYKGVVRGARNPDVFIDVQLQEYSVWIYEKIQYD